MYCLSCIIVRCGCLPWLMGTGYAQMEQYKQDRLYPFRKLSPPPEPDFLPKPTPTKSKRKSKEIPNDIPSPIIEDIRVVPTLERLRDFTKLKKQHV